MRRKIICFLSPRLLFQTSLSEASKSLDSYALGKVHFATANIQVPQGWSAADCQTPLEPNKPVRSQVYSRSYTYEAVKMQIFLAS